MGEAGTDTKKLIFMVSTLNTGGAQRALANMSLAFPDAYEIDFLLNDAQNICYEYKGNIIDLGLPPQKDKTNLFYQLNVFLRRYHELKKRKKSGKYIACISALTSANAVNILTKTPKCKSIVSIRNYTSKSPIRGLKRKIEETAIRLLYNRADAAVAVSESVRHDLMQNYGVKPEKVVTIYNGYDLDKIRALAQADLQEAERKWFRSQGQGFTTIVTAGRFTQEKGHWHLIRAMRQIVTEFPDTRLLILGEGELEPYLRELIAGCGLQDHVILCGFVKNPYHIISRCDLYVMPSLTEGFPNAMVEAMCCGLPVISADFDSGAREILAPETPIMKKAQNRYELAQYGVLCAVCDGVRHAAQESLTAQERVMADAVTAMLRDEAMRRRYAERALERAGELDGKAMIRSWIKLLRESVCL